MPHSNGIGIPGMYVAPKQKPITFNIDGTVVKVTRKFWYGSPNGYNCVVNGEKIYVNVLESRVAAEKAKAKYDRDNSLPKDTTPDVAKFGPPYKE